MSRIYPYLSDTCPFISRAEFEIIEVHIKITPGCSGSHYLDYTAMPPVREGGKVPGKPRIKERMLGRELADGEVVDHIDGDGLNNCRDNLRVATSSQNAWNVGITRRDSSGFKGVVWEKQTSKWKASIRANDTIVTIGRFESKDEAAWMRDQWTIALHGEFARLNFEYMELPPQGFDLPAWVQHSTAASGVSLRVSDAAIIVRLATLLISKH